MRWLVLVGLAGVAWGQGSGSIAGTVVDASSGLPLAGARLTLNYRETVATDDQGRFRFLELKDGAHSVRADLTGYASDSRGDAAIQLGYGERVENMRIRLAREAVVSGRVLDEGGRAIPARVTVTKHESPVQVADLFVQEGEYEVRGLVAGVYRISVRRTARPGVPAVPAYASGPTYEGSVEKVQVSVGERRQGLDIVARRRPAFVAVTGRFFGSVPTGERLQLRCVNKRIGGWPEIMSMGQLNQRGRFSVGLRPGEYVLQVIQAPRGDGRFKILGMATINVPKTGMNEEVVIRPVPLHSVEVKLQWADGRRPPPQAKGFILNPADGRGFLTWGKLQTTGELTATEVSVGVYSAVPGGLPKTCFVRAVLVDGVDATKKGVEIGEGPTPVVTFVMDDPGATVVGELVDGLGRPMVGGAYSMTRANGTLYERELWVRAGYADARGRFEMEGLAPGEYDLKGWIGGRPSEVRKVRLKPAGRTTVRLAIP